MWESFTAEIAKDPSFYGGIAIILGFFVIIFSVLGVYIIKYMVDHMGGINDEIKSRLGPAPSSEMKKRTLDHMKENYEDYVKKPEVDFIKAGRYIGIISVVLWAAWTLAVFYFVQSIKGE